MDKTSTATVVPNGRNVTAFRLRNSVRPGLSLEYGVELAAAARFEDRKRMFMLFHRRFSGIGRGSPFCGRYDAVAVSAPAGMSGHGVIASETDVYGQFKAVVRLSEEKKKYLGAREYLSDVYLIWQ